MEKNEDKRSRKRPDVDFMVQSGQPPEEEVPQPKEQKQEESSGEPRELMELRRQLEDFRRRRALGKSQLTTMVTGEVYDALDQLRDLGWEKTGVVDTALREYFDRRGDEIDGFTWEPYDVEEPSLPK